MRAPFRFFPEQFTVVGFVRHVSALCPLWPRFQTLSAMCPSCVRLVFVRLESALASPPNLGRHVLVRPCVRLALCRLWPRLQALCLPWCPLCPPCVRSLSFLCPLVVGSWFALSPLLVGFWPGLWFGFAGPLSAPCPIFGFCAFVCSGSVVRLSRCLCGCAFARLSSGHI